MPSGSHGGGGGGHSFGGSRIGRSSSPKPSFVHRHDVYYPPRRYTFFGRSYTVGSLRHYTMTKIGTWISIFVFAIVVCGVIYFNQQSTINQIKSDQAYYFNMIETAESNQYMNAIVTNQFEGEGGKYYITYNLDVSGHYLWFEDGYTYAIYTTEEASAIFRFGQIQIVVDRLPLTSNTDSINADYMSFDLSDDGSYTEATRIRTIVLIVGIIAILGVIGCSSYYFKLMLSHRSNDNQDFYDSSDRMNEDSSEKTEYCLYCGSVMTKSDRKCPQCGATRSYLR